MLKSMVFSLTLGLTATFAPLALAADSLFSEVPINSVFGKPGAPPAAPPVGPSSEPADNRPSEGPSGAETIMAAVKEAGFEPKQLSAQVISTKVQLDKWSFPVLVTTTQDKQEVVLVLLLSVVKDQQQLSSGKLLELLSASREHTPAYFTYSSKRQRIELYRTLDERAPSADVLKTEINRLAAIAKATESLWNFDSATTSKPVAGSPATAAPSSAAPAGEAASLVGKWSAARSAKEAFALQLSANGKYVLVHINQGQQTKSTGKFTFSGQSLTLVGDDGTRLVGEVANPSSKQFQFSPAGGKSTALTFRRAS